MYQRILFALDLEGINHVVGEPYQGLYQGGEGWRIARAQAVLEVNAAAEALFDLGVKEVALWDNHGGGNNVEPDDLHKRIRLITPEPNELRMSFAENRFDCICYFGYHAMEGTLGGVLAHTMSSATVQYYKLNGRYIGEIDMDAYIAAAHGMPSVFFAGGDIACKQAKLAVDTLVTAETKKELSRNQAIFRNNEELLEEIKHKIVEAVCSEVAPRGLQYPSVMEKSFKRTEDAARYLSKLGALGIEASHPDDAILGKDAHTVVSTVYNLEQFIQCI